MALHSLKMLSFAQLNMTIRCRTFLLASFFCVACLFSFAQDKKGAKEEHHDEFAKKKHVTKLTEVVTTDSMGAGDLMKRAVHWVKMEHPRYKKTNGTSSGSKAECIAMFPIKPKELNPEADYTGKITMKVIIECKDSKYRYTITDIVHTSKSGDLTGGSIDNVVPECGSQTLHDVVWKKLKGEALRDAALVIADIKAEMAKNPDEHAKDEW